MPSLLQRRLHIPSEALATNHFHSVALSMGTPQFRTPEIGRLYAELKGWDHPEHPFRDPSCSPRSYVPAIDFTLYIAEWLRAEKTEAISELWSHLTPRNEASDALLHRALGVRRPSWIQLADWQWYELLAMRLMVLRMSLTKGAADGATVWRRLAAITIALERIKVRIDGYELLRSASHSELTDSSPYNGAYGKTAAAMFSINKSRTGLRGASTVVIPLKLVAPMVRLVVYDYCTATQDEEVLNYDLTRSERMYGCNSAWNKHFIGQLGFFESAKQVTNNVAVPTSVRKSMLREALSEQGIAVQENESRASLIRKARGIDGLLPDLVQKMQPDRCRLSGEWKNSVMKWSYRVKAIEACAAGLAKLL